MSVKTSLDILNPDATILEKDEDVEESEAESDETKEADSTSKPESDIDSATSAVKDEL